MPPDTHSCAWCTRVPRRARVLAVLQKTPRAPAAQVARRLQGDITVGYVDWVRSVAIRRGCLPKPTCRCGRRTPHGGRCTRCTAQDKGRALNALRRTYRRLKAGIRTCQACGARIPAETPRYGRRDYCPGRCLGRQRQARFRAPPVYFLPCALVTRPIGALPLAPVHVALGR